MTTTYHQRAQVLIHLKEYGSITPQEALHLYGIMRLAARIHELRDDHPIRTERVLVEGANPFARYVLETFTPKQASLFA